MTTKKRKAVVAFLFGESFEPIFLRRAAKLLCREVEEFAHKIITKDDLQ